MSVLSSQCHISLADLMPKISSEAWNLTVCLGRKDTVVIKKDQIYYQRLFQAFLHV